MKKLQKLVGWLLAIVFIYALGFTLLAVPVPSADAVSANTLSILGKAQSRTEETSVADDRKISPKLEREIAASVAKLTDYSDQRINVKRARGEKLAYSIPILVDPSTDATTAASLICQLFTMVTELRVHTDAEFTEAEPPLDAPDVVVPIAHISGDPGWRLPEELTSAVEERGIRLVYGWVCESEGVPSPFDDGERLDLSNFELIDSQFLAANSFALTDYDRVLHLSINILPLLTLRILWAELQNAEPGQLLGFSDQTRSPLAMRAMLIRPTLGDYHGLCKVLRGGFTSVDRGWNDHGPFSSSWCSDWFTMETSCKGEALNQQRWSFQGANGIQGAIYFWFHVMRKNYKYLRDISRQSELIRFTANVRPWTSQRAMELSWWRWHHAFFTFWNTTRGLPHDACREVRNNLRGWGRPQYRYVF